MKPLLETDRLQLRPFRRRDLTAFAEVVGDAEVMKYIGSGQPKSKKEARFELNFWRRHQKLHGFSQWALVYRANDELIGRAGLCHLDQTTDIELGYLLKKAYWGQGLATEIGQAILDYGLYQLKLENISAITHPNNLASQNVIQKLGLHFLGESEYYGKNCFLYSYNPVLAQ